MPTAENEHPPPCLAERYGRAMTSSHLKLQEGRCDVDLLIAAGWLQEGMGASLYRLRGEFDTVRASTRPEPLNRAEMVSVLAHLKTLRAAALAFGTLAVSLNAARWGLEQRTAQLIAGRVLEVWLDPLCQSCGGRGFTGSSYHGEREMTCGGCRGTGKRGAQLGENDLERRFAWQLQDEIAANLAAVEFSMRKALQQYETHA